MGVGSFLEVLDCIIKKWALVTKFLENHSERSCRELEDSTHTSLTCIRRGKIWQKPVNQTTLTTTTTTFFGNVTSFLLIQTHTSTHIALLATCFLYPFCIHFMGWEVIIGQKAVDPALIKCCPLIIYSPYPRGSKLLRCRGLYFRLDSAFFML